MNHWAGSNDNCRDPPGSPSRRRGTAGYFEANACHHDNYVIVVCFVSGWNYLSKLLFELWVSCTEVRSKKDFSSEVSTIFDLPCIWINRRLHLKLRVSRRATGSNPPPPWWGLCRLIRPFILLIQCSFAIPSGGTSAVSMSPVGFQIPLIVRAISDAGGISRSIRVREGLEVEQAAGCLFWNGMLSAVVYIGFVLECQVFQSLATRLLSRASIIFLRVR